MSRKQLHLGIKVSDVIIITLNDSCTQPRAQKSACPTFHDMFEHLAATIHLCLWQESAKDETIMTMTTWHQWVKTCLVILMSTFALPLFDLGDNFADSFPLAGGFQFLQVCGTWLQAWELNLPPSPVARDFLALLRFHPQDTAPC